jgi:hypothetical protein
MRNVQVSIQDDQLIADGVNRGLISAESTENPSLFSAYFKDVPKMLIDGTLTGETPRQYYVWNGTGWAQITGQGEEVTIHE